MEMEVDTINLTMNSMETGLPLTARVYYVEGVNDGGEPRPLSMSGLVMAICLNRASKLEEDIVALMNKMNYTSDQLAALTQIEKEIVESTASVYLNNKTVNYQDDEHPGPTYTYKEFLSDIVGIANVPATADKKSSDLISSIESKMDEKNSLNQQDMIRLQSTTNKRDQAYDMMSNILKSFQTTITGVLNNL